MLYLSAYSQRLRFHPTGVDNILKLAEGLAANKFERQRVTDLRALKLLLEEG
ncbi:MAG TPA: hypothetical protein VE136_12240 [Anaerolineales bacterium]|nr:hypothetical protein [Anaerolineales bacterium]